MTALPNPTRGPKLGHGPSADPCRRPWPTVWPAGPAQAAAADEPVPYALTGQAEAALDAEPEPDGWAHDRAAAARMP